MSPLRWCASVTAPIIQPSVSGLEMDMSEVVSPAPAWQEVIFQSLKHAGVAQVAYVPDAEYSWEKLQS